MADASVHVLLNVDFKDIIGIEKYSSVFYGAKVDGAVDRNNSEGRGGAIPSLGEIRNCHINVGTGKELTIRKLSELVVKAVGFEGEVEFDASKPDGTMRKLISVDKLHSLGWTHKVEIEDGVKKLFDWYQESLKYSSVFYGAKVDGAEDRNNSEGRGGAIPSLGEIRNCHINVVTGKELTIRKHSELVVKAVCFVGDVEIDASKPVGTMRKLISVDKLHSLGWTHKVEIEDGVKKLFDWYQESLKG